MITTSLDEARRAVALRVSTVAVDFMAAATGVIDNSTAKGN
jgi:hypothetical protein